MNTFANTIIKSSTIIVEKNKKNYNKRLERVNNAYCEENENISPNIDEKGRFHAPCHGYRIPERVLNTCDFSDCYDEKLFSKGEYLPNPLDMDEFKFFYNNNVNGFNFSTRFRVSGTELSSFKYLQSILSSNLPFTVSFGKSWIYNNEETCNVYISAAWQSIISLFNDEMKKIENEKKAKIEAEQLLIKSKKGKIKEGKQTISCIVSFFKTVEAYMGGLEKKMIVTLENGSTAFGSIPKSIYDNVKLNDKITFTATFQSSLNDDTHGYFKRPSKAFIAKECNIS